MTFQLGFKASDGVLLASDIKHTGLYGYRTSNIAPKIKVSKEGNLACCSAGDADFCSTLENTVNQAMSDGKLTFTGQPIAVQRVLSECLRAAQQSDTAYRQSRRIPETIGGNTLFVFKENAAINIWAVNTSGRFPQISTMIAGEYLKAGDANSPAVFFPSHYFESLPNTVEALIPLAVHTVLMAESDYVKGVEIGIFTQDVFKVLSSDELNPYLEISKRIDAFTLDEFRKAGRLQ